MTQIILYIIVFVLILLNAVSIAYLFFCTSDNYEQIKLDKDPIQPRIIRNYAKTHGINIETERLAEYILLCAAKDSGGHCYPNQLKHSSDDIDKAFFLLGPYGKINENSKGHCPIFTINKFGIRLAANMILE